MVVIGLTGGLGTGKTTVAKMFEELGATVLDADAMAHQVIEPRRLAWRRIVEGFGREILNEDETVNRRRLGLLVFANEEKRKQLEGIVHPQVLRELKRQVARLRRSRGVPAVVLDVPLLVEAGAQGLADAVVVVTAPQATQRERLRKKFGWTQDQLSRRIAAQLPLPAKVAVADFVIDNGDGVEATRTQVKQLWRRLKARRARRSSKSSISRR
ncbi:MAG: dephospho-CoA kinase [Candidatus Omnitrophica bacterium]|nr:dephospho-CoA kinase [Candidatus Omnitrophota bacterium]